MSDALAVAAAAFEETLEDLGFTDGELGDPVDVGRRAALLVSSDVLWRKRLGELLDAEEVAISLRKDQSEVHKLVKAKELLALPTKLGITLFPRFQFNRAGKAYSVLPSILAAFEGSIISPYTIASWFTSPQTLLRRETPAGWLEKGRDPQLVIEAARRTSQRLGQ